MNIDAVQERAADFLLVAGDGHGGTTAFFYRIAIIAAGAPVWVAVAIDHVPLSCPFVTSLGLCTGGTSKEKTLRIA